MITLLICLLLLFAVPASAGEISEPSENLCIANVESYVNVRKAPSAESDLVGKMYRYGVGKVISEKETDEGTWYRIRSGHVTGYISSEFLPRVTMVLARDRNPFKSICRPSIIR